MQPRALAAQELAVVINENDPESVAVGEYYVRARGIPPANVVRVRLRGGSRSLSPEQFAALKTAIDRQLERDVQALLVVWTAPYAVQCQSITAALSMGFDPDACRRPCNPTRASPYFDSPSVRPYDDYGIRLAMLLPVRSIASAKALIDRGVASDKTMPNGSAYLLVTSDEKRSVRAAFYPPPLRLASPPLDIKVLKADAVSGAADIMFYLTGAVFVAGLDTLRFLPGALADHMTSTGGDLLGTRQMSAASWLEAGATASYGTVSEPCNHWQKFPHPALLLKHYLSGASAIEAYWKSVAWPTQGLFIGEPLAAPYRR